MSDAPLTASTVQPRVTSRLFALASGDKLPGSLLFVGAKGTGKWLVAHELAKLLTCAEHGENFCGKCDSCRQADRFSHPDILYLFPLPKEDYEKLYYPYLTSKATNPFAAASTDVTSFITIDSIRRFESKLAHRPSLSRNKVGIIYEAERMLPAAMDALLKTLEEPPQHSYLIVITDQPRFFPATIHSRLMRVNFPLLADEVVKSHVKKQLDLSSDELHMVTRFADGSLYRVEKLIEGDYRQTRDVAFRILKEALSLDAADFYTKHTGSGALESREKVETLLQYWQGFLHDLGYLCSVGPEDNESDHAGNLLYPDLRGDYERLTQNAGRFERIYAGNERIERVRNELRRNVNPRMAAFSFLLELSGIRATIPNQG